jgi:hypothetical protein
MKGTGLGELLFEADWIMKCMMIGTRSNKDRTVFEPWEKTSKLQELASVWDFYEREGPTNYTVYMSCQKVTVYETDDGLKFPEEPKIRIDVDNNPRYTDYITAHYNTVGYYDAQLLLKIREVPKLILVAEWLKKKGVPISTEWMMTNTRPTILTTRELAQNGNLENPTMEETVAFVQDGLKAMQQRLSKEACTATIPWQDSYLTVSTDTVTSISDIKVTEERLLEWTETRRHQALPWMAPLDIERKVKASYDDFDRLYDGMDPKRPLGLDDYGLLCPPVQSWQELYEETVPWPCSWQMPFIGLGKPSAGGGVNMTSFPTERVSPVSSSTKAGVPAASKVPVTELVKPPSSIKTMASRKREQKSAQRAQYRASANKIGVQATPTAARHPSSKPSPSQIPYNTTVERPSDDVRVRTQLQGVNKALQENGAHRMNGTFDSITGETRVHAEDGRRVLQTRPLRIRAEETVTSQGRPVAKGTVLGAIPVSRGPQQLNSPANSSSLSLSLPNNDMEQQARVSPNPNDLFSPTGSNDSGYIASPPNELESLDTDSNEDSDPAMNLDECSDIDDK